MIETFENQTPGRIECPVFPLGGNILFPQTVQNLHIFEPRYQEMTRACLDHEKLLCMGLLKPGYEENYYQRPEVHQAACLGRIIQSEPLPKGHFKIAVQGLFEVDLQKEVSLEKSYRTFQLKRRDFSKDLSPGQEIGLQKEVIALLGDYFAQISQEMEVPREVYEEFDLLSLVNNLCFILPLSVGEKLTLLEQECLSKRTFLMQTFLEQILKAKQERKIVH